MLPQRVWFLHHLSVKTGIDFAHFGLELGMVFEETLVVCECIYFVVSIPNQSERKKPFFFKLKSEIISIYIRSGNASGFGEVGSTPLPKISRNIPQPPGLTPGGGG